MSRASQRNALLIQHCYSPYRTTQFEKTIKKRQKGPVLAIKGPFGDLGGPDLVPTAPHWPAWVGLMGTTHFDLVLGPFWAPGGPKRARSAKNACARNAFFSVRGRKVPKTPQKPKSSFYLSENTIFKVPRYPNMEPKWSPKPLVRYPSINININI